MNLVGNAEQVTYVGETGETWDTILYFYINVYILFIGRNAYICIH